MNDLIKIEIDVAIWTNNASKAEMKIDRTIWNNASNAEKQALVNEFILSEMLNIKFKKIY